MYAFVFEHNFLEAAAEFMGVVTRVFSMQTSNLIRIRDMSILWDFEKNKHELYY